MEMNCTRSRAFADTRRGNTGDTGLRADAAAGYGFDRFALVQEFQYARNDINRALLRIAFLEQHLAGGQLTNLHLARKRRQIVPLESIQR
jgi:hypothetical protein